ncbi:MAG: relaxase [Alphaproteobacteria bacterium]|nr:relaxase [Alphaproteobacteria bacterium]
MILKGSQRAGANNLSTHLMNDKDNDHVNVYELRGFMSNDLHGSLSEIHAISKGTKCSQFMFSLSLSPPKDATANEDDFVKAIEQAELKLGLDHQPRAIVFHEKEGRRHAHVVWSRINTDSMTAINLPHFKRKLNDLARDLYLEHGWQLPDGFKHGHGKNPLNFTLAEWQQAKRLKIDPREIKQDFAEAWQRSDGIKAFSNAMAEKGYYLAKGDRRGFVAINIQGEVFSVPKWIGIKTKEVKEKFGNPDSLQSVVETTDKIKNLVKDKLVTFTHDVDQKHSDDFKPLMLQKQDMITLHKQERKVTKNGQQKRWNAEHQTRMQRLNTGFRGLWDKISGASGKIKKQNALEATKYIKRDQIQRDRLVFAQIKDRQKLQKEVEALRRKHSLNRTLLAREINQTIQISELNGQRDQSQSRRIPRSHQRSFP